MGFRGSGEQPVRSSGEMSATRGGFLGGLPCMRGGTGRRRHSQKWQARATSAQPAAAQRSGGAPPRRRHSLFPTQPTHGPPAALLPLSWRGPPFLTLWPLLLAAG